MNDASWMSIRKALSIQWGAISIPAALPSRCLEVISIYILVGTMSAVSVVLGSASLFRLDVAPQRINVTCWPGQEDRLWEEYVPTAVLYRNEQLVACGAEAIQRASAQEPGEYLATDFDAHCMHDSETPGDSRQVPTKTRAYTDILRFLLAQTARQLREDCGLDLMGHLGNSTKIIFSLEPGHDAKLRNVIEEAAILSGWTSRTHARENLRFMDAGEAVARFCILQYQQSGYYEHRSPGATRYVICDAGELCSHIGTFDIAKLTASDEDLNIMSLGINTPIATSACSVDKEFREFLERKLSKLQLSQDDINEYVAAGMLDFVPQRRRFSPTTAATRIDLRDRRFHNPAAGLFKGTFDLDNTEMERFFIPHTDRIINELRLAISESGGEVILLTGSFGEHPYVGAKIKQTFPNVALFVCKGLRSKAMAISSLEIASFKRAAPVPRPKQIRLPAGNIKCQFASLPFPNFYP